MENKKWTRCSRDFLQNMTPMTLVVRTDFNDGTEAGPINQNSPNSRDIHINFYNRSIGNSELASVIAVERLMTDPPPEDPNVVPTITEMFTNADHAMVMTIDSINFPVKLHSSRLIHLPLMLSKETSQWECTCRSGFKIVE